MVDLEQKLTIDSVLNRFYRTTKNHIEEEYMLNKLGRFTNIKENPSEDIAPKGQFITEKFPVLTFGNVPEINLGTWKFDIFGLTENDIQLNWIEFDALEKTTINAEFHCVTQWSKLCNTWQGVLFSEVMRIANVSPEAAYVMIHCYGGYTTNLDLNVLTDDDVMFASKHDGKSLTPEHGSPLRLVVPKRYGWKSAKWVKGIEFMSEETPGFWESRGYHMNGDPWKEERFSNDLV